MNTKQSRILAIWKQRLDEDDFYSSDFIAGEFLDKLVSAVKDFECKLEKEPIHININIHFNNIFCLSDEETELTVFTVDQNYMNSLDRRQYIYNDGYNDYINTNLLPYLESTIDKTKIDRMFVKKVKSLLPQMGRPTFYGETMRDVVLRMTDKQNSWLLSEAKKRGISKAQLVRDLVDKEMKA